MGLSTTFTGTDRLSARSFRAYDVRVLGCKVSQIEADHLARILETSGLSRVRPGESADVLVLHACTVTERADRDALRLMRRLRREHPAALLAVTGCLAERDPDGLARRPEVDLVAGHGSSAALVRLIEEVLAGLLPGKIAALGVSPEEVLRSPLAWTTGPGRTRAFLKIQDGCSRRCAFCIVPSLRGGERSAPSAEVEEAVHALGAQGVPEVVLCGVHLAAFGGRGESLVALLERLESRPPACRVRLSSLEPMEAGEALVDLVAAGSVVVPHLHLPLQSGSDAVLRRMRRGMTTVRFRTLLDRAWRGNPRFHLATDVIAGFPGETDAEFSETEALLHDLPLASLHVFPFSPRSGTFAAGLAATDGVPRAVVTRRAARLRDLDSRIHRSFARSHDGRHADVVSLSGGVGLTETYVEAVLSAGCPPPGSRFRARLALLSDGTLAAHPETQPPDRLQGF